MSNFTRPYSKEHQLRKKNAAPKPEKRKAPGSTLAASSKPVKAKGQRGERLRPVDEACRAAVFAEHAVCVVCEGAGKPDKITRRGPDEWAHFDGRLTITEAHRADSRRQARLCKTHHDWHHRRNGATHTLDMIFDEGCGEQRFFVDGAHVFDYRPNRA